MLKVKYNNIINIVWYQAFWFVAILGRETYEWVLTLLLLAHFAMTPHWRADAKTMVTCGGIGIIVDSILASQGIYVFDPVPALLPIPLWLTGIWFGFACTLLHSFSFFMTRPLVGTFVVAALAPFSYLAGVRFGAVDFGLNTTTAMIIIGLAWGLIMPALSYISGLFRPAVTIEQNTINQPRLNEG